MYILSGYQTKTILPCWLQICCQRFEFTPQSTDWRLVDRKLWSKVELFVSSSSSSFLFAPSCILPIPCYLCSLICSHSFAFFNIRQCMPALFNQYSLSTDFRHRFQCVCLLFYLRPFFVFFNWVAFGPFHSNFLCTCDEEADPYCSLWLWADKPLPSTGN